MRDVGQDANAEVEAVCGSCGFTIVRLVSNGPPFIVIEKPRWTRAGTERPKRVRAAASFADADSPPHGSVAIARQRFVCPKRKCRAQYVFLHRRLSVAFEDAVRRGRRRLVLGVDL
jgi:hypothetical protein